MHILLKTETFSVSPSSTISVPLPILILMGAVLIGMLFVWWKSKRDKK
ncbi:hypothetical protein [Fluviicola sp.]